MAHQLTISASGVAAMAYVGETPWHGLGQQLPSDASIDEWRKAAGLDFQIISANMLYSVNLPDQPEQILAVEGQRVLHRSDNGAALGRVSSLYKVVQPEVVLGFFNDLSNEWGYKLETAGTLFGGRTIWALARTRMDDEVVPGDMLKTYILLTTCCDGNSPTIAQYTSVRVVCNNTLQMSLAGAYAARAVVRHTSIFEPGKVFLELGLKGPEVFETFMTRMRTEANRSITIQAAEKIIEEIFHRNGATDPKKATGFSTIMSMFNGGGIGATMDGVAGTGWGLINAVTQWTDHTARAKSMSHRLDSAWFGKGADMKKNVLSLLEQV